MFSLTLIPTLGHAWGDLGHATVGYIAEKNLTPKGRALVHQLVGQDPLSEVAIWPDQVRSDSRYNEFGPYHYVTIPEGSTYAMRPQEFIVERDANTILSQANDFITSKKLELRQREILFRYLVHLAGDVHQPFHAGNQSDLGANLCQVRILDAYNSKYEKRSNLHSAWDDALVNHLKVEVEKAAEASGSKIKYFAAKDLGEFLIADYSKNSSAYNFDRAKIENEPLENWYTETQSYHKEVYPDGGRAYKAEERPYCRRLNRKTDKVEDGAFNENAIPLLDAAYIEKAKPIIKKQILVAGFRLAKMINSIAEKSKLSAWTPAKEKAFFDQVLIKSSGSSRTPSSTKSSHTPSCEH